MTNYTLAERLSVDRILYIATQLVAVCYLITDKDDPDFEENRKFLEDGLLQLQGDLVTLDNKK